MKIPAIREITIIGMNVTYEHGVNGITEIQDRRREYPDNTEFIYNVMKGNNLFIEIINAPVIVEHFDWNKEN